MFPELARALEIEACWELHCRGRVGPYAESTEWWEDGLELMARRWFLTMFLDDESEDEWLIARLTEELDQGNLDHRQPDQSER